MSNSADWSWQNAGCYHDPHCTNAEQHAAASRSDFEAELAELQATAPIDFTEILEPAAAPTPHSDSLDKLTDLVEEVADAIKANRSMGVGEESIDTLLRERFRDRLFDALLSEVPLSPIAPELQSRIRKERESVRDAIRAHSDSLDVLEQDAFVKEARRACRCLFIQVPESVARDVQMKVEAAFGSLLSRIEAAERERALVGTCERCGAVVECHKRINGILAFYEDEGGDLEPHICTSSELQRRLSLAESENARMAEVLEAAREWFYVAKTPRARIEAQARIVDALEAMDAARAASPDVNREKK